MKNFSTLLACAAFALAGCGDDTPATPTDASVTPDMPDTGTPGCFTQEGSAPLCPSAAVAQADTMRPNFRVSHIKITAPTALASAILGNTVNGAIHSGGFLWGMSFDLMGNTVRTGALNSTMLTRGTVGQGLLDGTFHYYAGNAPTAGGVDGGTLPANRWDPVSTTLTASGDRVNSGMVMGAVRLPIYDTSGALLTELPLEDARLTMVNLSGERRCIGLGSLSGGRFNECTSNWQTADGTMMPYGRIEATITVAAARQVNVSALMTTLCNLLAGSPCETTPMNMWARQPDAMVAGQPGYALVAEFSAVSARIQ